MNDDTAAGETVAAQTAGRPGSTAGLILRTLVVLAAGAALALWGLPRIAPSLPAPVAAWLTPAGAADAAGLRAIEDKLASVSQIAETALAAAAGVSDRLAELDQRVAALSTPDAAAADAALAERLAALEAALADLRAGLGTVAASGGADPAILDELRARIDAIAASGGAGGAGLAPDVAARLAALEAAHQEDVAAREAARDEAESARRAAAIAAGLAQIDRAMTLGLPFADTLDELEAATGATAPAALAAVAAAGPWTREALKAAFPAMAHEAIEADLAAGAEGGGAVAAVLARFRARVTGLPTDAVPGDSAPAVLSRARLSLLQGDLDAAVAAIRALPAPAQAAMAAWTEAAEKRAAADAALAAWRADLKLTL